MSDRAFRLLLLYPPAVRRRFGAEMLEHTDPLTLIGVSILLLGVAAAACCLPGRRAARIDPMEAIATD